MITLLILLYYVYLAWINTLVKLKQVEFPLMALYSNDRFKIMGIKFLWFAHAYFTTTSDFLLNKTMSNSR